MPLLESPRQWWAKELQITPLLTPLLLWRNDRAKTGDGSRSLTGSCYGAWDGLYLLSLCVETGRGVRSPCDVLKRLPLLGRFHLATSGPLPHSRFV
jgi:hypothetical protein